MRKMGKGSTMADFTEIKTQEELDKVIGERLKRERESIKKSYSDYDEIKNKNIDYEQQLQEYKASIEALTQGRTTYENTVTELNEKIRNYEKTAMKVRIARENGIPYDLANRLSGDDEKSILADAYNLAQLLDIKRKKAPLKDTEPSGDSKEAAYKALLTNIKGD